MGCEREEDWPYGEPPFPEQPPTLSFRFWDPETGKNYFFEQSGVSRDDLSHVDSVRVVDEYGNKHSLFQFYNFPRVAPTDSGGWSFSGLAFCRAPNGYDQLSRIEVKRRYFVEFKRGEVDTLAVRYRFTTKKDRTFLAQYVWVYWNGRYLMGTRMSNRSLRVWLPV